MNTYYEWDELKRQANIAKHSVDFSDAPAFVWADALTEIDYRHRYSETRWIAFGPIARGYC